MLTCKYTVERIDGDYAMLRRLMKRIAGGAEDGGKSLAASRRLPKGRPFV